MDPLAIAASIGSLAGFALGLLTTLSEFVDAVREAPREVQCLSNELASLYAALGQVKIALQSPRVSTVPPAWIADVDKLVADCHDTLADVQRILDKARATQTAGSATQLWKVVTFEFESKQVDLLRKRIHERVEELVLSRRNVKEVLVVLDRTARQTRDNLVPEAGSAAPPNGGQALLQQNLTLTPSP